MVHDSTHVMRLWMDIDCVAYTCGLMVYCCGDY